MNAASVSADRSRRFDSLEQEVFLNLWRTHDRLRIEEDRLFGNYGLTPQQYNALRVLRGEHPASLPTLALAERLVSRAPDITRMLDKLQRRELIERERPNDNRRVVHVRIAAAGVKLLDEMAEAVRDCHVRQLGHLSRDKLQQLTALLQEAREPHEAAASSWAIDP